MSSQHTKAYEKGFVDGTNRVCYIIQEAVYDGRFTITLGDGTKLEVVKADKILNAVKRERIKG